MRCKSLPVEVSKDSPYHHDLLGRQEHVENVATILKTLQSPIVFSVNSPWGHGKTTFLRMLHAELSSEFPLCVYFNAWETDFASDPLLAFLGEVSPQIESHLASDEAKAEAWSAAKRIGGRIAARAVPAAIKAATFGALDANEILETALADTLGQACTDLINDYKESKQAIVEFKQKIRAITGEETDSKIFVFIDELDRCRPTYAIELLERVKHLLDVEGLVFTVAMDKAELSHSVKAIYGSDFDAPGYLKRFIDLEYTLPEPELGSFVEKVVHSYGLDDFLRNRSTSPKLKAESDELKSAVTVFGTKTKLALRDIEQLLAQVNIIFRSATNQSPLFPRLTVFLLVIKQRFPEEFRNFTSSVTPPDELIDVLHNMFSRTERLESAVAADTEGLLIASKHNVEGGMGAAKRLRSRHATILNSDTASAQEKGYSENVQRVIPQNINIEDLLGRIALTKRFHV